jgi:hypothetical protein
MNRYIFNAIFFSIFSLASCEENPNKAYKIICEIYDDKNKPIQGANIEASKHFLIPESPISVSQRVSINALTDVLGIAKIDILSVQNPGGVCITKNGFYPTTSDVEWDQPLEYNGTRTANVRTMLKPVKNPISMFAHVFGNTRIRIPTIGVNYGYDLEMCEFVSPYGKGKCSDIIFLVNGSNDGNGNGRIQMTIRTNGEKTGFYEFLTPDRERGSILISDYVAPDNCYKECLTFEFDSNHMSAAMSQPKDRNYYFRVRCRLNSDGSINSCHYGKLYGPFTFWNIPLAHGGVASFGLDACYFNPTPNDRNVEFDTKRNFLHKGNVNRP